MLSASSRVRPLGAGRKRWTTERACVGPEPRAAPASMARTHPLCRSPGRFRPRLRERRQRERRNNVPCPLLDPCSQKISRSGWIPAVVRTPARHGRRIGGDDLGLPMAMAAKGSISCVVAQLPLRLRRQSADQSSDRGPETADSAFPHDPLPRGGGQRPAIPE